MFYILDLQYITGVIYKIYKIYTVLEKIFIFSHHTCKKRGCTKN